jgi:hypothetical protein
MFEQDTRSRQHIPVEQIPIHDEQRSQSKALIPVPSPLSMVTPHFEQRAEQVIGAQSCYRKRAAP